MEARSTESIQNGAEVRFSPYRRPLRLSGTARGRFRLRFGGGRRPTPPLCSRKDIVVGLALTTLLLLPDIWILGYLERIQGRSREGFFIVLTCHEELCIEVDIGNCNG
jgi:hypothetical protein